MDDVAGTAQVGNGAVLFKLNKKEPALWGRLQSVHAGGMFVSLNKNKKNNNIAMSIAITMLSCPFN